MNKYITLAAAAMLTVAFDSCKKQDAQKEIAAAQAEANVAILSPAERNLQIGQEFLEENGKRPEVTTTPSGLQYEVLEEGTGPKPTADQSVTVHYTGKLIDGTVFDSSVQRGEPITFSLRQVIRGWTEGLQLMPRGSKYRLFIPANLAYGERGAGSDIGPNETLIFDVELLDIE